MCIFLVRSVRFSGHLTLTNSQWFTQSEASPVAQLPYRKGILSGLLDVSIIYIVMHADLAALCDHWSENQHTCVAACGCGC
jgi:hypothetical protein